MEDREAFESRRALLQLYASNSLQFAGFTLAMGVIFVGLLQVLLAGFGPYSHWVHSVAVGLTASLVVVGFYLLLIAMYWNRMTFQAIGQDPTKVVGQNQMDELLKMHVKAMEDSWLVKRFHVGESFIKLIGFKSILAFAILTGFAVIFL